MERLFVGIPGNPVSSIVCGHVFLRPVIRAMLGLERSPLPLEPAILGADVPANGPRQHLMCARAFIQERMPDDKSVRTTGQFPAFGSGGSRTRSSFALHMTRARTVGDAVNWIRM